MLAVPTTPSPTRSPAHPVAASATTTARPAAPEGAARRHDLLAGARAMAPWLTGIAPFGLVIGMSAAQADIPTLAGFLTGPLVFSGSAQVAAIELLDAHAGPLVVVAAVMAINLRLALYSATMADRWRGTPVWWRAVAAYLLVEPSLAVGIDAYESTDDPRRGHRRYVGGGVLLWVTWLVAIGVGATAGARLPGALHLDLVIPLFLVGEIVPRVTDGPTRRAVGVAAAVAVVATAVPLHLGPMLAIAAGIAAALGPGRGQDTEGER